MICSQAAAEVEAALEDLDPQVILFVDHHADLLARIDDDAAGALGVGMLAADELPLDEELPVDGFQRADVDVDQLAGELALLRAAFRCARGGCCRSRRGRCRSRGR